MIKIKDGAAVEALGREAAADEVSAAHIISTLYRRHFGEIFSFVRSMLRCNDEAADVTQEAFINMYRRMGVAAIQNPRNYLFKTARNLSLNTLVGRRNHVHVSLDDLEEGAMAASVPSHEKEAYSNQRLKVLLKAVDELPPICKEVFWMYRFEQKSHREIALLKGISRNMVEKHIMKAMARCRRKMFEFEEADKGK